MIESTITRHDPLRLWSRQRLGCNLAARVKFYAHFAALELLNCSICPEAFPGLHFCALLASSCDEYVLAQGCPTKPWL